MSDEMVRVGELQPRAVFKVPGDNRYLEVVRQSSGLRTTVRPLPGSGRRQRITDAITGEITAEFEQRNSEGISAGTLVEVISATGEQGPSQPDPVAPSCPTHPPSP
jgi:hypothetical protein